MHLLPAASKAVAKFPGVYAAPLVLATTSGCGGKFTSDFMLHAAGLASTTEMMSPGFSVRGSFLCAALYT